MDDVISRADVIDILLNEMECVQRVSDDECNRDCAKCDLLKDTDKILQAYRIAVKSLEHPEENVVKIIPCGDLISRQAAIHLADELKYDLPDDERIADMAMAHNEGILDYQTKLSLLPSAEKTGRWKRVSMDRYVEHAKYWYECNKCGKKNLGCTEWCPNCGSHMIDEYVIAEGE